MLTHPQTCTHEVVDVHRGDAQLLSYLFNNFLEKQEHLYLLHIVFILTER